MEKVAKVSGKRKCHFLLSGLPDILYNTGYPVYIVKSNTKSIQGTHSSVLSWQLCFSKYPAAWISRGSKKWQQHLNLLQAQSVQHVMFIEPVQTVQQELFVQQCSRLCSLRISFSMAWLLKVVRWSWDAVEEVVEDTNECQWGSAKVTLPVNIGA